MSFEIAWTQHRGRNPGQQDALWNGHHVFQQASVATASHTWSPDTAPKGQRQFLALAVADGVANSPVPQRASRQVLEELARETANGATFDTRLVRHLHGLLCDKLAHGGSFGSSTTLAAACLEVETNQAKNLPEWRCRLLNVGDSRIYLVSPDGTWQQASRDHTLLNSLIERGEARPDVEYASMYQTLDSCLVADDDETDFAIHSTCLPFPSGASLLLCTDGVHDVLGDSGLQHLTRPGLTPKEQVLVWRQAILRAGAPDNFSMVWITHHLTL